MKNFEEVIKSSVQFDNLPKSQMLQSLIQKYEENTNKEYSIFRIITFSDYHETAYVYDFENSLTNIKNNTISVWGAELNYDKFIEYMDKYGEDEVLNDAESITTTDFLLVSENINSY